MSYECNIKVSVSSRLNTQCHITLKTRGHTRSSLMNVNIVNNSRSYYNQGHITIKVILQSMLYTLQGHDKKSIKKMFSQNGTS